MKTQSMAFNLAFLLLSCLAVPVLACCPPPQPPCYRCEDGVWVWNCSSGQNCCGGTCYNPATQKCCTDPSPYLCSSDQTCCKGNCCNTSLCYDCNSTTGECEYRCKNRQCCINGNCVDPMCDNCHTLNETLWECSHWEDDPDGAPCSTIECILNLMYTASCSYKGSDWPCDKSRCDTLTVSPWEPEQIQIIHVSPCPGGIVFWEDWKEMEIYWGCATCILHLYQKACETNNCFFNPFQNYERGSRNECGTCGYW